VEDALLELTASLVEAEVLRDEEFEEMALEDEDLLPASFFSLTL